MVEDLCFGLDLNPYNARTQNPTGQFVRLKVETNSGTFRSFYVQIFLRASSSTFSLSKFGLSMHGLSTFNLLLLVFYVQSFYLQLL